MSFRSSHTLALVLLAFSSCKKIPPVAPAGPLPVNVVTVAEKEVIEWDEFTGRIEAVESVEIRARVSGYLQAIHFKAGAMVKAGDPLFTIDPRPYQADLDRATADFERAEAEAKLAGLDFKRTEELRGKNLLSAEQFDQKAAAQKQAEASVRSAKAAKERSEEHTSELQSPC